MTAAPAAGATQRDQNRKAIFEVLLHHPDASRGFLMRQTSLSRSTVSRVVDELLDAQFLVEDESGGTATRGRPSKRLRISRSLGKVIGVDVGATTVRAMSCDLAGNVIDRVKVDTPEGLSVADFASWLVEFIESVDAASLDARLRHAVVSFPAKIIDGIRIERPARSLRDLEGAELYARVSSRLPVPLSFRRDPDMALLGELRDGKASGASDAAMIVTSTALATSLALGGRLVAEGRPTAGDFSAMPYGVDGLVLGDVLSVQGILARADREGRDFTIDDVFRTVAGTEVYREDFLRGLAQIVFALALTVEPEIIILTGRLLPLVAQELESLKSLVGAALASVPDLVLSETGGFSQPRGSVEVALEQVRRRVHDDAMKL